MTTTRRTQLGIYQLARLSRAAILTRSGLLQGRRGALPANECEKKKKKKKEEEVCNDTTRVERAGAGAHRERVIGGAPEVPRGAYSVWSARDSPCAFIARRCTQLDGIQRARAASPLPLPLPFIALLMIRGEGGEVAGLPREPPPANPGPHMTCYSTPRLVASCFDLACTPRSSPRRCEKGVQKLTLRVRVAF